MLKRKLFCCVVSLVLFFAHTSWAQLTIATNGSVGIGTDNPESHSKLHVLHNDYHAGYFTSNKDCPYSSNTKVIRAEYTGSIYSSNPIAVYGKSNQAASHGYGGYFEGGSIGVYGRAIISGYGTRYGVYGYAYGGSYNRGIYGSAPISTNSYAGYFNGNVYVTGTVTEGGSSLRIKKDVKVLDSVLPKLIKLKAKSFKYKEDEDINFDEGTQFGFIAEELEEEFPDLVLDHEHIVHHPEEVGEEGPIKEGKEEPEVVTYKVIKYSQLIPILVQAIQEQQEEIEELKKEMGK